MKFTTLWDWAQEQCACEEALVWLKATQPDAEKAWATCPDGSWMLWALGARFDDPRWTLRAVVACLEAGHEKLREIGAHDTTYYDEVIELLRKRRDHPKLDLFTEIQLLRDLICQQKRVSYERDAFVAALGTASDEYWGDGVPAELSKALSGKSLPSPAHFFADIIRKTLPWEEVKVIW